MGSTVEAKNLHYFLFVVFLSHSGLHDSQEIFFILKDDIGFNPYHLKIVNISLFWCDEVTKINELSNLCFSFCGLKLFHTLDKFT